MNKKNIVIFGGANGTSLEVRALKPYINEYNLNAVVSVFDSGRTSAKMRSEIGTIPLADVLRVACAFSEYDHEFIKEVLYRNRMSSHEKLNGFNIGTLFLGLTIKYTGDIMASIKGLQEALRCVGGIYPATLELADLCAELSDGRVLHGEGAIDRPCEEFKCDIQKVWLEPNVQLYTETKKIIEAANVIITGPGDLYTSNIASMLADGTKEAILASGAKIIYVAGNKYSINGECAPRELSARVAALEKYMGKSVNHILYNNHVLQENERGYYTDREWDIVVNEMSGDSRVIEEDLEEVGGGISTQKLGNILRTII